MAEPPRFHLPADAQLDEAMMADGARIRCLTLDRPGAAANLLVLNGRADFLEKWADAYAELAGAGFAVAGWDWRGQGRSTRLCDSGAGHIDRFDRWLGDMDELASCALERLPDRPWLALGHSMGGHLLLRWLADPARRDHPLRRRLKGAILLAPLFGLGMAWPLRMAVLAAARRQVDAGRGADFASGQLPYGAHNQAQARMLLLTASRTRFEDEARWVAADPALACGGVSWGWLAAFDVSERALEALPLEALDLPLLLLFAARERLVSNPAALKIAARLPTAMMETIPMAAHELLREADAPRRALLSKIRAFAASTAA